MGNAITNNMGILIENKQLGIYIKNWALDEKTNFFNKETDADFYNNILKKRACCSLSQTVKIPFVDVTRKNNKNILVSSAVGINIFNDPNDFNTQCKLFNKDKIDKGEKNKEGYIINPSNLTCGMFHAKLCDNVLIQRSHLSDNNKYYGPNNDSNNNDNKIVNPYVECNCLNSEYVRKDPKKDSLGNVVDKNDGKPFTINDFLNKLKADNNVNLLNRNDLAQTFDDRCKLNSATTIRHSYGVKDNLCINAAINIQTSDNSRFNQSCSINNNQSEESRQARPRISPPISPPIKPPTRPPIKPPISPPIKPRMDPMGPMGPMGPNVPGSIRLTTKPHDQDIPFTEKIINIPIIGEIKLIYLIGIITFILMCIMCLFFLILLKKI